MGRREQVEREQKREHFGLPSAVVRCGLFDENESAAFAIGLKLFREVMLHNRDSDVFKELDPHFSEFMKAFKKM